PVSGAGEMGHAAGGEGRALQSAPDQRKR
ncbi:host specificity protein J, partial [Escherichia coli]|nr:host specificity protein J [Escherichia coli]